MLAQITRAAYPRRNHAQITHGATLLTPAPNPRDKAISAGRKFGTGSSRKVWIRARGSFREMTAPLRYRAARRGPVFPCKRYAAIYVKRNPASFHRKNFPGRRPGQPQPPTRLVPAPLGLASPLKNGGGRRQFHDSITAGLLLERPRRPRNSFDPPRPTPLSRKSCAEEQPGNAENISPPNYAPPWLNQHHGAAEAPRRRQYRLSDGRYLAPPLRRRVSRPNRFSGPLPPRASSPSCAIPIPNSPDALGTKG